MFIAVIAVVAALLIFVLLTFLLTRKSFKFQIEDGELKIQNSGSHLKVFFNNQIVKDVYSPQLFIGEKIQFKLNDKDLSLFTKCNQWGTKFQVQIFEGDKMIADNGVVIDQKNK